MGLRCEAAHSGDPAGALDAVREALGSVLDDRVQGIVISVPGMVEEGRYVHVAHLDWGRLDLRRCVEADWPALLVLNDARLAGLGEARRGALRGISTALHFPIDFDLGGTLLVDGRSQAWWWAPWRRLSTGS